MQSPRRTCPAISSRFPAQLTGESAIPAGSRTDYCLGMPITDHHPRPRIPRAVLFAPLVLLALLAMGWAFMAFITRGPLSGDTKHDFGVIEAIAVNPPPPNDDGTIGLSSGAGVELSHTFHLTNRTNRTLTLRSARPDCGCASVNAAFPMSISPGGPVDLPVTMRVAADGGKHEKTVLIHLDFGDDGRQVLRVKAATR